MDPMDDPEAVQHSIDSRAVADIPTLQKQTLTVVHHGASAWARSYRIEAQNENTDPESYFMKVSVGDHGRAALHGEYESTLAIHRVVGDFTPKPIAWGSFSNVPDSHYYICKFYDLAEELPEPSDFAYKVATLHKESQSPHGKFGFDLTTYNGDLPQENGFVDTWEECFLNGFIHMLKMNIERGGPWEEMENLRAAMIEKVIPRLLRPLEIDGRSVKPSLVHGDLWCGNAAVDVTTGLPLVYDPSSFYAHNEYELGNWRPERNKFTKSYFRAYHSHIPKAFPEEDYDDRNALYAMWVLYNKQMLQDNNKSRRFNLHASALFPEVESFRRLVIEEMNRLVLKYPDGFEGFNKETTSFPTA